MPVSISSFFVALSAGTRERRWGDGRHDLPPVDESANPDFWAVDYTDDEPGPELIVVFELHPLSTSES